ncbi:MAG TPA: isoprenylcysteine carboxylmethyltransferase family protein [Terriglobales bacterium]|jgi:protein-S-isoprenylcysteine O-methyltransferase Ste14|nr:isoprenylcysteine carboxylmethyltransferase family protein [Terriglobales bacterium]
MFSLLRTAGWLLAIVLSSVPSFWLLVHPRAEYWRNRRGARFRILGPLWIAMWLAVGAITQPWRHVQLYENALAWVAAAPFFAAGLYLYYRGKVRFSFAQLIGRPEVHGEGFEQRLVTTGIRARVRHPVYLGHLCELIGWSLGTGLVVIYVLTGLAIITGTVMIRMEDDELERRFGESFRQYRKATPAVIPRLVARVSPATPELRAKS